MKNIFKKSPDRKLGDNFLVLCLKSYAFLMGGTVFGYLIALILGALGIAQFAPMSEFMKGTVFVDGFANSLAYYGSFIGVFLIMLLCFKKREHDKPLFKVLSPSSKGNNLKFALLGILLGGGMNVFCILCAMLHGDIGLHFNGFNLIPILVMLVAVFIQCTAEELINRCYLLQRLMKGYKSPAFAIVGTSIFFAFCHALNPGIGFVPVLNIVLIGILFAMIAYYYNSFICVALAHTVWNFSQGVVFGLPNSGNVLNFSMFALNESAKGSFFYDPAFGVEGSLLASVVILFAIVGLFVWMKKHPAKPENIWA